ncbi:hypothetical protein SAICODRAFT_65613 [Saitoella complicata NRRL Y-17804]|uniref:uncharacterized protein n=1 Tax=Saitoella complicata (strain BCRC 22490 / CBS 7301 / JCM 7358 / NBRC 10748 / NRRL Y-17804) TaxID=698492 RepID=UPI000868290B|nr:uncharacterized protein SAICODRAFT_65613 [Saitoella complicata NRRL Y-17804]ODQ53172.1 hypothetical protein SAICODRAFT_65613 [Saitoella complicata NRRL Y-17804]
MILGRCCRSPFKQALSATSLRSAAFHTTPPRQLSSILEATHTLITTVHEVSHTPWYLTIPLTTILLRTATTLPIAVRVRQRTQKMMTLKPIIMSWRETLRRTELLKDQGRSTPEVLEKRVSRQFLMKMWRIYSRNGCNPLITFLLPLVHMPLFIVTSLTLRGMAGWPTWGGGPEILEPSLVTEGALWFPDLTVVDPTMALPVALGIMSLANIEITAALYGGSENQSRFKRILTNAARMASFAMMWIATQMPTTLVLYWITSTFFSTIQNFAFHYYLPIERSKPLPTASPTTVATALR